MSRRSRRGGYESATPVTDLAPPPSGPAPGAARRPVVTLTRHEILDRRRQRVAAYGLDLAWLERFEHTADTRAVASWLEDHNFYALAEDWVNWSWLLNGEADRE